MCIPACFLFAALGIVGLIALAAGWDRPAREGDNESPIRANLAVSKGPPPWWAMVLFVIGLSLFMWVLYLMNADY